MNPNVQDVQKMIIEGLTSLRQDLALPVLVSVDGNTPILGNGSDLDSMAVVHLIVDLEGRLLDAYGLNWILADERALSRSRSPLRSVAHLTEFIIESKPEE
jgi:acyl carrier protein